MTRKLVRWHANRCGESKKLLALTIYAWLGVDGLPGAGIFWCSKNLLIWLRVGNTWRVSPSCGLGDSLSMSLQWPHPHAVRATNACASDNEFNRVRERNAIAPWP
jgi:hypothetical protein